jgi:hypothetical protein
MYKSEKKYWFYLILPLSCCLIFNSCKNEEQYPLEPVIEFKDFKVNGQEAVLTLSFTDGDGDIGLQKFEVDSPYNYNMFLDYYEKKNGVFVKQDLPIPFSYRIPMINKSNRPRPLKGDIRVDISPTFFNPFSLNDTLRLDIYIQDRKLNKSNIVSTPELVKPK